MMNKIELLAPAKDLFKAKTAILYGADAVYVGGKRFSLRSRASNFSMEDLSELSLFAKEHGAKVYVTVNIVFRNEDLYGIREYLEELEAIGIDGIIVTSLGVLSVCKAVAPSLECHVSTQFSSLNSSSAEVLRLWGADRVVLGREVSAKEIAFIAKKTKLPLEVFIHGGMCSNYSGRCVLSDHMAGREANRGGCAHACRWRYQVYEGDEKISEEGKLLTMSSRDLRAGKYVEDLIKAGAASLKIEGRMKSEYYIAQVVRTYRAMIDEIYELGSLSEESLAYYENELQKAENRPFDEGFLKEGSLPKQLYTELKDTVTHDYVGYVRNYDRNRGIALVEVKNRFENGEELELFGPDTVNRPFTASVMFDGEWKYITLANKASELLYMRLPFEAKRGDMIRKVHP